MPFFLLKYCASELQIVLISVINNLVECRSFMERKGCVRVKLHFPIHGEIWRKYTCSMEAALERVIDRNHDNVPCLIAATSVICLRYARSTHLNTSIEIVFQCQSNVCGKFVCENHR